MVFSATANVLHENRVLEDMQYLNSKYASGVDEVHDIDYVPVANGASGVERNPVVEEVPAVH